MSPLVSVITPAFNASCTIEKAIISVQGQTYQNWEMLIVDDGSNDGTCDIIREIISQDDRVRLLRQPTNRGVAHARNLALSAAIGRYVAFLDSDDYWLPNKLERQLNFMLSNDVSFSYTLYRRFEDGCEAAGPLVPLPPVFTYEGLLKNSGVGCLTVIIDTDKVGPIVFQEIKHEDYVLWLELLRGGGVAQGFMEDLARYRVSAGSVSGNKLKSAAWVWNVYRNVEKLSLPYAIWCFVNYAWNAYNRHV